MSTQMWVRRNVSIGKIINLIYRATFDRDGERVRGSDDLQMALGALTRNRKKYARYHCYFFVFHFSKDGNRVD